MRILIIADKPPWPAASGGALATMAVINGLIENDTEVSLIYAATDKHPLIENNETEPYPGIRLVKYSRIKTRINLTGLLVNLLFSKKPYNISRFKSKSFIRELRKILMNNEFDIIQVEGLNMSVYLKTIRQLSSALIAIRSHNIEHEIWERLSGNETNRVKKIYLEILAKRLKKYELRIINKFDLHIPITERDNKYFINTGINIPSFVYPYAKKVDAERPEYSPEKKISYIGSLDWKPNQEGLQWFLNKVWKKLYNQYPEFKFHVAGRNAPEWLIRKLDKQGIIYHGAVKDADKFILSSGILVIPLFSGSGIRVRAIQAMSKGIPVISSTKGIEGINVENGKELLLASSAEDFVNCIIRLSEDRFIYDEISNNSMSFVRNNYNNESLGKKLKDFYLNRN